MALHGNKSQSARTQALAGFKSGDIRALVATDIAARGIDIDDLPHVVNYEIPNVPEDYVHRIGRTGRAGNDGAAVSLVCLDEEGFMQEIERFTKQRIPVPGDRGFRPRARRARRADRHGPPDHLGRRGQAAQPRSDDGGGQGGAPGNDAAHPRQQGRRRRTRFAQRRPQRLRQRLRQRLAQRRGAAAARPARPQAVPGPPAAPTPRRDATATPSRRARTATASRAATSRTSRATARTTSRAPSCSATRPRGTPMANPTRCAPAWTAWADAGGAAAMAVAARTVPAAAASVRVGRAIRPDPSAGSRDTGAGARQLTLPGALQVPDNSTRRRAMWPSGSTSRTPPMAMALRGMPNTMQLASSWARV